MFAHSIRFRLQLWLGLLLLAVLCGFGLAVYQLQAANRLNEIDQELERRMAVLNLGVRGGSAPISRDAGDRSERREPRSSPPPPDRQRRPERSRLLPADAGGPAPDAEAAPRRGGDPPPDPRGEPSHPHPPRPRRGDPPDRPPQLRLNSDEAALFGDGGELSYYYAVWSVDGRAIDLSPGVPPGVGTPGRPGRDTRIHRRTRAAYREAYQFTERGDCVLAGVSLAAHRQAQNQLLWTLSGTGFALLALGLSGGWWLTSRAIRPVEEISAAASRISAKNLTDRITTSEPDNEIGRLAGVLNHTFSRLEAAFAKQKQFVADASHELRTPLAVLISEAQTALARERSAAEYKETVQASLAAAQEMRQLTESLLELARLDAPENPPTRERVDLADLAESCLSGIRPIAAKRGLKIASSLQPAECVVDGASIGRVITNLLANAVFYSDEGGEVAVATDLTDPWAVIRVTNAASGVASDDLEHVFDRFYRGDKARSAASGHRGTGLGLAICKEITEAHGGEISAECKPGSTVSFTVRLRSAPHGSEP